jgi:TRAP-type C4-dicarboxylate transport system permease large subunit
MQRDLEESALDFDRYPRTGNYFVKRASAYVADVLLFFVISFIFLIIIGAMIFGRFMAVSGVISAFSELMMGLPVHRMVVLVIILLIYLILGTFMEAVAILCLTLPIFTPLL